MQKINGTLKVVAKTGGLKLEETGEVWMNPNEQVKQFIGSYKKGDKVELTIGDDGLINFIKKSVSEPVFQPTKNVNQTNNAGVDWDTKDKYIRAQSASKDASIIISALINSKELVKEDVLTVYKTLVKTIYNYHKNVVEDIDDVE